MDALPLAFGSAALSASDRPASTSPAHDQRALEGIPVGDAAAAYVGEFVDGRIPKPPGNARSKFRRAFSMGLSRTTIDDALTL